MRPLRPTTTPFIRPVLPAAPTASAVFLTSVQRPTTGVEASISDHLLTSAIFLTFCATASTIDPLAYPGVPYCLYLPI